MNVLTLTAAAAAIEAIEQRRSQLAALAAQTGSELADAEAGLGEAVLNGDNAAVGRVADLRLRADGLAAALTALDRRLAAALLDQRLATAADLRRRAGEKRAELETLEKKTGRLLESLSDLEGIRYDASILSSQRTGTWFPQLRGYVKPEAWLGFSECWPDPTNGTPIGIPRSRLLRKEIAELEAQALAIETELAIPEAPAVEMAAK